MGLWNKLTGQFIDVIEWTDESADTLVFRFDRGDHEIKNNAKLTVRPSQAAVFVSEGEVADVFNPGLHTLTTSNLPILTSLKSWKYGFNSPFKAEVYFVNTRNFTDLKWGTKNPITMRDADFGIVRLRAFGSYTIKVIDPRLLVEEIVGTDKRFTTDEIANQLRNIIITRFTDVVAELKVPILDLATQYDQISETVRRIVSIEFNQYGIEVTKLLVENISLPPEVEAMVDKKSSMNIMGNMNQFAQFQAANAIQDAANNPNGMAGVGMGYVVANQMGGMMNNAGMNNVAPPPIPQPVQIYLAVNGVQQGPYDMATLQMMIRNGSVQRGMLAWKQGMPTWTALEQIPEVAAAFGAVPPPMPPM
jgi:membrane protease subunit (stomatin/prohibitin family)